MAEEILIDYAAAGKLHYAIFRYFNAAGADAASRAGERHTPETHLIPLLLQVAEGKKEYIMVYGDNYPTIDGTCVRDYVHVTDICNAHLLALKAIENGRSNLIYNLGSGCGYTVKQVIEVAHRVTKRNIPYILGERREGDPAILVADSGLVKEELGWQPKYNNLESIILHAYNFMTSSIKVE